MGLASHIFGQWWLADILPKKYHMYSLMLHDGSLLIICHELAIETGRYANNRKILNDDVIKWKHFPRNWPFMRGIHRSPVNSPHKGQGRGGLMFSLICVWINDWVNNHEAGDLRRYRAHFDVIVMLVKRICSLCFSTRWPLGVVTQ